MINREEKKSKQRALTRVQRMGAELRAIADMDGRGVSYRAIYSSNRDCWEFDRGNDGYGFKIRNSNTRGVSIELNGSREELAERSSRLSKLINRFSGKAPLELGRSPNSLSIFLEERGTCMARLWTDLLEGCVHG